MQKKGLSGVIVTVLIVLLAIVAVILVWTFTKPFLDSTLSQLELDSLSSSFVVVPGSLVFNDTNVNFLIERKSGSTDVSGFNILLEDSDGKSKSFYVDGGLAEFETKKINIDYSTSGLLAGKIVKVTLVPIFLTEDGKKVISKNPIVVSTNNFVSPPAPGSGSSGSSGSSVPVGNIPEAPNSTEFIYNFVGNTYSYSNFMLSLPLNATSKRVEDIFPFVNTSNYSAWIVTVVYVHRGDNGYISANRNRWGWSNPYNITINDGEAFYVAVYNATGKILNVTGVAYTSAVPIKFNKTLTMFGVPYCANNYDASDLLAEISANDPYCDTILKYNNSINGQFEFYSNNLAYNRSGMWSDFKILDYEGYWLMCGQYGDPNAHVPSFTWTPSCNPTITASRPQANLISSCGTISQPGNYYLANDLTTTGSCLNITSSNVMVDGNNHSITGDGDSGDYGVSVNGVFVYPSQLTRANNVTLKNLVVRQFGTGIILQTVSNNLVSNNILVSNIKAIESNGGSSYAGILSVYNIIQNNDLGGAGIIVNYNQYTNSIGNRDGGIIYTNNVKDSVINDNINCSISVQYSPSNVSVNNNDACPNKNFSCQYAGSIPGSGNKFAGFNVGSSCYNTPAYTSC